MKPYDDLVAFERQRSLGLVNQDALAAQLALQTHLGTHTIVRVYYGPPGTGKTLRAVKDAVLTVDAGFDRPDDFQACFERMNELSSQIAFITFHPSLQYEDVVESIRPRLDGAGAGDHDTEDDEAEAESGGERLKYIHYKGPIMRLASEALNNPSKQYALIVDEINRGDVSRILGPLLSAIEPDKRIGGAYPIGFERQYPERTDTDTRAFLPANLHVFGTMNSADRNIALVDYALRRRFEFISCPPEPHLLGVTDDGINLGALLRVVNNRIAYLLDDDHRLGHSYLMGVRNAEGLVERLAQRVLPLLFEYFYGNEELIALVLGEHAAAQNRILRITRPDDFAKLFGLSEADAAASGVHAKGKFSVQIDPRFWNVDKLPPGPDDRDYARAAASRLVPAVQGVAEGVSSDPDSDSEATDGSSEV